jgi:hypothetical protein
MGRRPDNTVTPDQVNYRTKGDENRKLCSMYLSVRDKMGVKLDRFGDADARLVGI